MHLKVVAGIFFTVILFSGCTKLPTTKERTVNALSLLTDKTLVQENIQTSSFKLFTLEKINSTCRDIKIYVEGDGLAWQTRRKISSDPTPLNPIALSLMDLDESSCKAYIARPCQYVDSKDCSKKYWTSHRFSPEVIQSYNEALNIIKNKHKNSSFTLVGYSGGGAVVTLLSAKRDDISRVITVAGNLDTDKWVKHHHISALDGSLNPADYANNLQEIQQYHLVGSDDTVIPKDIFISYKNRFSNTKNLNYKLYKATHTKNWQKHYKNFLKELKINE